MTENGKRTLPLTDWEFHVRDVAVSLCQPATRMVVLSVPAWEEDDSWQTDLTVYPVVAVASIISKQFSCEYVRAGLSPVSGVSEKELYARGWSLDSQYAHTTALIVDEELGLCRYDDDFRQGVNVAERLLCCPWPPEDDQQRFAPVVKELQTEALGKAIKHKAKMERKSHE